MPYAIVSVIFVMSRMCGGGNSEDPDVMISAVAEVRARDKILNILAHPSSVT